MWCGKIVSFGGCAAALVLAAAGICLAADEDKPAPKATATDVVAAAGKDNAAEKKIRAALEKPTTVEFVEVPLKDVVDFLKDVSGIPIVVDRKLIAEGGISTETPIALQVKGLKLRSILNLCLRQLGGEITWIITDEVLFITNRETASSHTTIRVYSVRDLLGNAEAGRSGPTADEFVATLKSAVAKNEWDDYGGAGTLQQFDGEGVLIVSQNATAHEAIESLLEQLRDARPSPAGGK